MMLMMKGTMKVMSKDVLMDNKDIVMVAGSWTAMAVWGGSEIQVFGVGVVSQKHNIVYGKVAYLAYLPNLTLV